MEQDESGSLGRTSGTTVPNRSPAGTFVQGGPTTNRTERHRTDADQAASSPFFTKFQAIGVIAPTSNNLTRSPTRNGVRP